MEVGEEALPRVKHLSGDRIREAPHNFSCFGHDTDPVIALEEKAEKGKQFRN